MSTDTAKIRSKLAKLAKSLDTLESQLEPLLSKPLPETLLALDTIQQAKLQVVIPYVVYDLVFVYLKTRGIDPKTHRVVAELERVRQYFDKIKNAEESVQKRKTGLDKAAAGRFIKHAIAQAKNAQLADDPSDAAPLASSSSTQERVPIKITSKMLARTEYKKELVALGSEEEDDLEVIDEDDEDDEAMNTADGPPEELPFTALDKSKARATEEQSGDRSMRKRPRIDPFSGYDDLSNPDSTPVQVSSANASSRDSVSTPEDREANKATKRSKRKAKKQRQS